MKLVGWEVIRVVKRIKGLDLVAISINNSGACNLNSRFDKDLKQNSLRLRNKCQGNQLKIKCHEVGKYKKDRTGFPRSY